MAAKEIEVPGWLVPGAQVVVWTEGRNYGRGNPEARVATVTTVGKMWFGLDGFEDKIRIDRLCSKDFGSSWNHWRYRVVERDSDEAAKLLNKTNADNAKSALDSAIRAYEKDAYNDDRRAQLRDALDRFDDALNLFRGK